MGTLIRPLNISTDDSNPCNNNPSCTLIDVPNDFTFRITFYLDTEIELLYMGYKELTSCGNAFSIGLTGGNPNGFTEVDNTLPLWESTPGLATVTEYSQFLI